MTQLTALLLTMLTMLSIASSPVARSASITGFRAENAPTFSSTSAAQHVEALSVGIGSRVAGSAVQAQTHQYLTTQFQEFGYQTELQPFTISAYQDRGSTVALTGATGEAI